MLFYVVGDEGNEDNLDDVLSLLALSYETISTAATNGTSIIKITSATTEKITDTTSAVLPGKKIKYTAIVSSILSIII